MSIFKHLLKSIDRTNRIYKVYRWKKQKEQIAFYAWFNEEQVVVNQHASIN
jgi:hypothetical protein